jgi:hypothetical protein
VVAGAVGEAVTVVLQGIRVAALAATIPLLT